MDLQPLWLTFSPSVQPEADARSFIQLHTTQPYTSGDLHIDFKGVDQNDKYIVREWFVIPGDSRSADPRLNIDSPRLHATYLVEFMTDAGAPRQLKVNGRGVTHSEILSLSWASLPWAVRFEIAQIGGMERGIRYCVVDGWGNFREV